MTEKIIYDNKYLGGTGQSSKGKNTQINQFAQNYGNKFIVDPHQIPKNLQQQSQKKINFSLNNKAEQKVIPQSQNMIFSQQQQHVDTYQIKAQQTQPLDGSQKQRKGRKLRQNFDFLQQAMKNSTTSKKDKQITFSSDSRVPQGVAVLQMNNQHNLNSLFQNKNYIVSDSPQVPQTKQDSLNEIYNYGGIQNTQYNSNNPVSQQQQQQQQQQPFKDRKSSCYEVFGNYQLPPTSTNSNSFNHQKNQQNSSQNLSLYSHISLKDGYTPDKKKIGGVPLQSRNQNQMVYHNLPQHNTQPVIVLSNEQKSFMRVNDKLMRKYVAIASNGMQVNEDQNRSNSQAILNISTASDINIYNNSFIVNTSSKKAPQSQNQSRSNSLRRNQNYQGVGGGGVANMVGQIGGNLNIIGAGSGTNKQQMQVAKILGQSNMRVQSSQGRTSQPKLNQTAGSGIGLSTKENRSSKNQNHKPPTMIEAYQTNYQSNMIAYNGSLKNQIGKGMMINSQSSQRSFQNSRNSFEVGVGVMHSEGKLYENYEKLMSNSISKKSKIRGASHSSIRSKKPNMSVDEANEYSPPQINDNEKNMRMQKSNVLTKQGKQKLMSKDYQQAIQIFSDALQIDPNNLDAMFYRALSYLDSGLTKEAIDELNLVLQSSKEYQQIAYILLSIAYKRSNNITKATKILSDCISSYPQYPDAYLARGQGYLVQEKYDQALRDFNIYTKLMPNSGVGFLGIGDSNKSLKKWNESIQAYSNAISILSKQPKEDAESQQHLVQAYLKRGIAGYNQKSAQQALKDFYFVLSKEKNNAKVNFYIGKILSKQINKSSGAQIQNDAILHFEQVVKYSTNEIYTGNALLEIAKLRLKEKDFYEAYFNLKRALDSNFTSKRMQLYKDFTEGVLYLIKRKIKKGVQILSDLLEILVNNKEQKDKRMIDYLKHQVYIYRAYGFVAIEKYEIAIEDINKAKKIGKVCQASVYNKLLGKGILRMDHEEFLMATKYFNKASAKFPQNKDPYCLYVISIVRSYTYSLTGVSVDQEEKKIKVMETKEFMDRAISNCNKVKEPSLFFFRGLLNFHLHLFYEALQDFNIAIEEEEEPTASYYLARGRCYACLSILTEAMKDLSIALNLDDSLQEAYIYRGKCAYLLGDNNLAFLDFQRLILTDPKNPMVHVYAGNLLMTTGAYQDAIKAFLNADTVKQTAIAAFQRARCFCALTELDNAYQEMENALKLVTQESLTYHDKDCVSELIKASNSFKDIKTQKQVLSSGIQKLNKSIEQYQQGFVKQLRKKDSPLNIQIIPNVKRIKMEKVAVAKEMMSQQNEQKELTSISIDVNQTVDLDSLKDVPLFSYYYENVFQIEDFYLFRAVFYFYMQEYDKAVSDFKMCQNLKNEIEKKGVQESKQGESMIIFNQSRGSTPILSMHSSKTDLSDVGLCSLNTHETNFNLLLCYMFMKDREKTFEKIHDIISNAPKKYSMHFYLMRGLLYEQYNEREKSQKDLAKAEKLDSQTYNSFFKENKELNFEPFPVKNRLCHLFGSVTLKLGIKRASIITKPSFSMPFIKPPNMIPNIDEELLQEEFNLKQIDAPMPEAPWIKRWQNGIQFTDQMQKQQSNLKINNEDEDYDQNQSNDNNFDLQNHNNPLIIDEGSAYQEENLQSQRKHLSQQVLQQAKIYLVDQEEQLSDKNKISLFDDSRFEDITIEKERHLQQMSSDDESDEEDSSSENPNIFIKIGDRDSMVLVGDHMSHSKKKTKDMKEEQSHNKGKGIRDMGNKHNKMKILDEEEKKRVISELHSNIDGVEEDLQDRESLFRSRQSSLAGK